MTTSLQAAISRALCVTIRRASAIPSGGPVSQAAATWSCMSCRWRQQLNADSETRSRSSTRAVRRPGGHYEASRRYFTSSSRWLEEKPGTTLPADAFHGPRTPASTSTALPSYSAKQRSALSKRLTALTDSILARASVAGQHINTYTGTDFSGIEALRKEIEEQEAQVKSGHSAVGNAKDVHTEARAKQAASQKEIVGLLERKSSWSPSDLERYMSLVRSEHVHDQTVQKAAEELAMAERELEGTRSLLEKLERKQYHEEQIWSDTIRRNSTWVTIGLMGINILLLLAQISIFEPYRRRKIVKQIMEVLDQRAPGSLPSEVVIQQVDAAVEPTTLSLEELSAALPEAEQGVALAEAEAAPAIEPFKAGVLSPALRGFRGYVQDTQAFVYELFSDRAIQVKQIDITTIALKSAAAGMAFSSMMAFLLLRSAH